MLSSSEVLAAILEKPTDLAHVRALVTEDVTYVSPNYDNPDLHSIMPWCGTHDLPGPRASSRPLLMTDVTGRRCPSRWRLYSAQASTLPCSGASATNRR